MRRSHSSKTRAATRRSVRRMSLPSGSARTTPSAGVTFYEGVFGWRFEPGPSGNGYMIFTPEGRGGIHGGDGGVARAVFFAVDDIERR